MSLSSVASIQERIQEIEASQKELWGEIGAICSNTELITNEISLLEAIATDDIGSVRKSTSELATSIASAGQAALAAAAGVKQLDFVKKRVVMAAALVDQLDTQLSALSGVRSALDEGDLPVAVGHYRQLIRARNSLLQSATPGALGGGAASPAAQVEALLGPESAIVERRNELMAAVEAKSAEYAASGALGKHLEAAALLAELGAPQRALRVMRPAIVSALTQVAREAVTTPWEQLAATTGARAHVALLTQLRKLFDSVASVVGAHEDSFRRVRGVESPTASLSSTTTAGGANDTPTRGRGVTKDGGGEGGGEVVDGCAALGLATLEAVTGPASDAIRALLQSHKSDPRLTSREGAVGSELDLASEETAQVAFACSVFFEFLAGVICGGASGANDDGAGSAGVDESMTSGAAGGASAPPAGGGASVPREDGRGSGGVGGGGGGGRVVIDASSPAAKALAAARTSELAGLVGGDLLWLGFVPLSRRHLDVAVAAIASSGMPSLDAVDDVFYIARQAMLRACRTRFPAPIIDGLSYVADETILRFVESCVLPPVTQALAAVANISGGGVAAGATGLTLSTIHSTIQKAAGVVSLPAVAEALVSRAALDALHSVAAINDYAPRLATDVEAACVSEGVRDDLLQPPAGMVVGGDGVSGAGVRGSGGAEAAAGRGSTTAPSTATAVEKGGALPTRLATRLGPFSDQVKACLTRLVMDPWERAMLDVLRKAALEPILQQLAATPFDLSEKAYAQLDLRVGWTQAAEEHWAPLLGAFEQLPEVFRDRLVESLCRSLASAVEATVFKKRFNALGGARFELDCRAIRSFWASVAPTANLLQLFQRLRAISAVLTVDSADEAVKDCLSSDDVRRLLQLRVDLSMR